MYNYTATRLAHTHTHETSSAKQDILVPAERTAHCCHLLNSTEIFTHAPRPSDLYYWYIFCCNDLDFGPNSIGMIKSCCRSSLKFDADIGNHYPILIHRGVNFLPNLVGSPSQPSLPVPLTSSSQPPSPPFPPSSSLSLPLPFLPFP